MGTAALVGSLISAAVAGTSAIVKAVKSKKNRKEREVNQVAMQEQIAATKGNYQAYRRDAEHDRANAMHASMEMFEPVWDQMQAMYPSWERPDFEGAMRMNESRPDTGSQGPTRPLSKPDKPEDIGSGSYVDPVSGHTYNTGGAMTSEDVRREHMRGDISHDMNTSGSSGGANRGSGPGPMGTTGNRPGGVGGH